MIPEKPITRKKFLYQAGMLGGAMASFNLQVKGLAGQEKKIRVGLIGCGSVSTQYLPHLSKSPYVELVSTCDTIPERAQQAARKYNIPNHYPSIEKMLAGAPFDLLVNTTDMQEHGRTPE